MAKRRGYVAGGVIEGEYEADPRLRGVPKSQRVNYREADRQLRLGGGLNFREADPARRAGGGLDMGQADPALRAGGGLDMGQADPQLRAGDPSLNFYESDPNLRAGGGKARRYARGGAVDIRPNDAGTRDYAKSGRVK